MPEEGQIKVHRTTRATYRMINNIEASWILENWNKYFLGETDAQFPEKNRDVKAHFLGLFSVPKPTEVVRFFTPCTADWGLDFWPNQKWRTFYTSSVHCQGNPALNSCSSITAVSCKPETTRADFPASLRQQLRTSYLGQTCALTFPGSYQDISKLKAHSATHQHHTAFVHL